MGLFGLRESFWSFDSFPAISSVSGGLGLAGGGGRFAVRNDRTGAIYRFRMTVAGPSVGAGFNLLNFGDIDSESQILFGAYNTRADLLATDFLGDCVLTIVSGGVFYGGTAITVFFHMQPGAATTGSGPDRPGFLTNPYLASRSAKAVGVITATSIGINIGGSAGNCVGTVTT